MLTLRRSDEIYSKDGGWFQARWHFSFDEYRDPERTGVGALIVFNDDRIAPGAAWPMHPHRDIESLTYVVEGAFAHADSLGNGGQLAPGAAQVMDFSRAGAMHSERNASHTEPLRFIQFWILPSDPVANGVQQEQYEVADRTDQWLQIMGPPGEDGLELAQDARVLVARLTAGKRLTHPVTPGRGGYLYLLDGDAWFDSAGVDSGDAAVLEGPHDLLIEANDDSELMLVDVPLRFRRTGIWARQ